MRKKLWIWGIIGMMLFTGCSSNQTSVVSSIQTEETTVLSDEYEQLDEENALEVIAKEDLKDFIEHGTGILFLGYPACPWCQSYLPILDAVLKAEETTAYYYNIREDKDNDRDFYNEVAQLLIDKNATNQDDIVQYDNDGKMVIYMPLTLFIEHGGIKQYNGETNTLDSDEIAPEDYWTDEKVEALKETLTTYTQSVKRAQEENEKGCDNGCTYGQS